MEHIKREKDLQNLKIENMEKSKNKQKFYLLNNFNYILDLVLKKYREFFSNGKH